MNDEIRAALHRVEYLKDLDDVTLADIVSRGRPVRFRRGERIVTELEAGSDVYVLTKGEAQISVEPRAGERQVLGTIGAGNAFGEMSSLTGELRSATVTALGDAEALVISDADFDRLRARRPEVAVALVRILGKRLAGAERAIDALLAAPPTSERIAAQAAVDAGTTEARVHARVAERGSISRAWRELVINRRRDLGFLALLGFVATLVLARLAVYLAFRFDIAPREVLRGAYLSGFLLLALSAMASLLTFRAEMRRAIAFAYGVGVALIVNELGVTLAFDIFFKDIHTPDPDVPFDIERLYRRTEPLRAIAIGLVVLVQAAYLRPFYRRAAFVVRTRLRKVFARRA
jgi:CRP-like cAMP-binding protein